MAEGGTLVLDNAEVWVGTSNTTTTKISGYVASAMLHFEHPEIPTAHTFGQLGQVTSVSEHYTVNVTLDLITDGYDAAELDRIMTSFMRPPLGPSSGTGRFWMRVAPDGADTSTTTTPAGSGCRSCVSGAGGYRSVGPAGQSGAVAEIVRQTRTFTGTGNWERIPPLT